MKIIHHGTPKPKPKAPWVGLQMTCKNCDTIFQLEEGDGVQTSQPRAMLAQMTVTVTCPVCKNLVETKI